MISFTIDGQKVSVPKGTTVYTAATQLGIDIPIFCYHDRMPPFGACRMCLVEVEKMPKLQTSCTLEATEGMVINTQSKVAAEGREQILELLLINHPLDCPICDRGGECPLQDQTMKFGPGKSRFYEKKRRFRKAIPLGPVLELDRERCIVCARCTRFSDVVSGDHALEFIDRGFKTEVGTPGGGTAESKFIGNTIMICPVGALTSRVYRFRARPWDNKPTESTCTLCPVGCSLILDSRDGEIMRTRSSQNRDINDIWLCDKGWFGYEFSAHLDRLTHPLVRRNGKLESAGWDEALSLIAQKMKEFKPNGKLAALGGNPLTTEENYLFQKLMRTGAGVNHVDHRIGTPIIPLNEEGVAPGMEISIGECEALSYVVLLGVDLTEEFPVIWLRLKQAINRGAKVVFIGHFAPEIAKHLSETILHAPGNEIEMIQKHLPRMADLGEQAKGAVFVGRQYLDTSHRLDILAEVVKVKQTMPNVSLNIMEGRGNSIGARLAGMRPDLEPLGKRADKPGFDAVKILENASSTGWDFLYVAGANPVTKFPSGLWTEARKKLGFLVVQDLFLTETAQQADVVLPTLNCMEKGGSFINISGQVQILRPGKEIPKDIYSDGEIFTLLAQKLNIPMAFDREFAEALNQKKVLKKMSLLDLKAQNSKVEKQNTGSLAAAFAYALFDQGVRMKHDPHLIQLAKEPRVRLHPIDGAKRGVHQNDQITLSVGNNAITAKVKLDDRVAEGTVVIPLGFDQVPAHELGTNLLNGLLVNLGI